MLRIHSFDFITHSFNSLGLGARAQPYLADPELAELQVEPLSEFSLRGQLHCSVCGAPKASFRLFRPRASGNPSSALWVTSPFQASLFQGWLQATPAHLVHAKYTHLPPSLCPSTESDSATSSLSLLLSEANLATASHTISFVPPPNGHKL